VHLPNWHSCAAHPLQIVRAETYQGQAVATLLEALECGLEMVRGLLLMCMRTCVDVPVVLGVVRLVQAY